MTRLLPDAHISGRAVGRALSEAGHDVRAIDSEKELEGLEDSAVLELAVSEGRVLITADVEDFMSLIMELGESGNSHTGCILIPKSVRNEDFGAIISGVKEIIGYVPPNEWIDRVAWLTRK